jgi:hypothetical protein
VKASEAVKFRRDRVLDDNVRFGRPLGVVRDLLGGWNVWSNVENVWRLAGLT